MLLARHFAPLATIARVGHDRVAGDVPRDFGQFDPLGERQEQRKNFRSADHPRRLITRQRQRVAGRMRHLRALRPPPCIARNHEMPAPREQPGQAVERLAPHDHRPTHGQRLEPLEVRREPPRQPAVTPDHAIARASDDQGWGREGGLAHRIRLALAAPNCKACVMRLLALLLAFAATTAPAETLRIRVGHLVDPEQGLVFADQLVTLTDGKIASITPWQPTDRADLDWSRRWVLPGLIDLHTHVADGYAESSDPAEPLKHSAADTALKGAEAARIMLHSGFTTVRDVGVYRGLGDVALRNAIRAGEVEGPRMIVAGGYVTIPGGGGAVTGAPKGTIIGPEFRIGEVRTPDEARVAVDRLIHGGADFIKLIATGAVLAVGSDAGALELTPAEMQAACDEAKRLGSYCIAHAHGTEGIKAAMRAGAWTIEHASLIDDEGLAMAKARHIWLDMDIYDGDWIEEVGTREHWTPEYLKKNRDTTDLQRSGFAKAVKRGVPLTFGTDAGVYPHGLGARQFAYMVRYGMTPMQAIVSATAEAAKALRMEGQIGTVRPGSVADLVAVDRDPIADISVLRCIADVVQAGRLIHRDDARQRCDR